MSKWQPIETAPKDGTKIRARGSNFGYQTRGSHAVTAVWRDRNWVNPNDPYETFLYLDEWRPLSSPALTHGA